MAAVLGSGPGAALSHSSAASLWSIGPESSESIEVSVPATSGRRQPGVHVHRRTSLQPDEIARCDGIPATIAIRTLLDLAVRLGDAALERMINETDKRDLTKPTSLLV
jgi:hypothetical protein